MGSSTTNESRAMSIDSILALTEIGLTAGIGIVFGAACTFLFTYKKTTEHLDRIHELEQIIDKNKIWIKHS
mgnify:CR=1 FL=1